MDTKQQAIQQSLNNFEQIQNGLNPGREANWFNDYWNKGFQLGRFQEKEDWAKPAAQFANFLAENVVEPVISSPGTLYQGGVDISQGNYYSGTGKLLKGALDVASVIPVVRGIGLLGRAATAAKAGKVAGLGKTVLTEAGINSAFGAGYGLAEGLIKSEDLAPNQRLGTIGTEVGVQAGLGAAFGAAFPLAGAGLGKSYRYFFPEKAPIMGVKSELADDVAKSMDSFKTKVEAPTIKTDIGEVVTPKIEVPGVKVESPTVKVETPVEPTTGKVKKLKAKTTKPEVKLTTDISDQTPRNGKKAVDDAVASGKVVSTSKKVRDKAGRILDNLLSGNEGGANNIIKSSSNKDRKRTFKFLESLYNKGNLPEEYRDILKNYIDSDTNAGYVPRKSGEAFQQARQKITEMNYSQKVQLAKELVDKFNAKINQLRDAGVSEVLWPRKILDEFVNSYPSFGDNETVIEDYINALAFDLAAKGDSTLSKQLSTVTANMYTASGQIVQSAVNSLGSLIKKTEDVLDSLRSKVDKETYTKVKQASRVVNDALAKIDNDVLNDPKIQETLFDLEDFFVDSIAEAMGVSIKKKKLKDEQVIANAWKKAIDALVPSDDKGEGSKISESILQSILIGKSELQSSGITPKTSAEELLYQRLKYAFDNIDEISQKVELAKNELRVLISQDPNKMAAAEVIFNRMVPEVFVTRQVDKMYSYLVKDLKPNFKELAQNPEAYNEFRKKFTSEFFKRVPVDNKKAAQMVQLLRNKLDSKYELAKSKIKQPGQVVAERVIKTAERVAGTQSEQFESDVTKMLIELSYQTYKKEMKIPAKDQQKVLDNIRKDMYAKWRMMLENPVKFRQVLLEAQEIIRQSFPNRVPEVDAILQNYMGRVYGDVWAASDITKAAQDQLRKNKISIVDLVKKHASIQGATMDDLKTSFINDLGVSPELADGMVKQFSGLLNAKAATARKQVIDRILAPVITEPKERASASKKLLEYANLGIFDDVKTANVLAEKLKLPHLSDADAQFIASRLSEVQTNPNFTYDDAIKAIGKRLAESNPLTLRNGMGRQVFFDQYYYNNIFSGFQTQMRNIWGGLANGIVYKNAMLLGDAVASKILNSGIVPRFIGPADRAKLTKNVSFGDLADYNKAYFGALKQGLDNFNKVYTDEFYVPATESPDINYYTREYQKKQLPGIIRQVGNFMEATDQLLGTLAEAGELAVAKKRGMTDKEAAEQAFLFRQEILGRSEFKRPVKGETGAVDALFDRIGNFGTQLKGRDSKWNYITTPLFPVLRLAVNFQKLKARLFPPTQLINILSKNPESRTLTDYAYLSVGTATSAFAIQKYLDGEIAFEAPKDEAEKKLFYDSGRKPYSVKIGDSWVPFSYLELFSAPFIAMGAMQAAFQDDPEALTEGDATKILDAMGKFTKAFFISPTYLQVISKLLESGNGYQKDPVGSALAFSSTGFIPFVGLVKDIVDIIDPIKRKKQDSWDEFKALVPDLTIGQFQFQPGLRSSMEPYKTTDLQPTPLTATELYAPYGIGTVNQRYDRMYQDSILTKQQQKLFKEQLKPETERISKAQEELELAILQNDMQKASELAAGLTKGQVGTVTERINRRIRNEALSPEERALYGLTSDQLNTLQGLNPGMSGNIDKIKNYKDNFESPKQSLFDQLKTLTKDYEAPKIKGGTTKARGGRRLSVKKVGKRTVKAPKKTKVAKAKKTKPIKIAKLKPLKKTNV